MVLGTLSYWAKITAKTADTLNVGWTLMVEVRDNLGMLRNTVSVTISNSDTFLDVKNKLLDAISITFTKDAGSVGLAIDWMMASFTQADWQARFNM